MDEFKRLPWLVSDFGTDLEATYALNMPEYHKHNPTDVFFCNLMGTDPLHFHHGSQNLSETDETEGCQQQFVDPRTGIEIPSHECNHKDIDLKTRNIFLINQIEVSKLQKHEHAACLNAIRCSTKSVDELSIEEKRDRMLYESTAEHRSEEKKHFLEKLREHYFSKISHRFHKVPPPIDYFVTQNWKKRLIIMHRQLANARYRLRTAILLQTSECLVKMNLIHQKHVGCVPQMTIENVNYLRASFSHLMKAYNHRKITQKATIVKQTIKELMHVHDIDFVIPISIFKVILNTRKEQTFCMTVKDSDMSTTFNARKEIIFEKTLPPTYLSGNARYKKGAKYLLHSCLNRNSLHVFSHNQQIEMKTLIDTENIECDSKLNNDMKYIVSSCDEFIEKYPKRETFYENMTFSVFGITGCDNDSNDTFKMLVPSKQAAYKKKQNGDISFLNYSPKIEFQSEYGAESMKKTELIDEWCDLYFRPNTTTERIRFDCETGKLIHRQSITITELENELKTNIGIESQHLLRRLWHTLRTFSEFPTGEYLLQSDSNRSDCLKVYEKSNDIAVTLSIQQIIKDATFERNLLDKVVWQPLDDKIVIEYHEKCQILPCSFPHIEYLRQHNVKSLPTNERHNKSRNTKVPTKLMKICPKDDSQSIIERANSNKLKKNEILRRRKNQLKNQKRSRRNARKKEKKNAEKSEMNGINAEKQLLNDTMDQYTTPFGVSNNELNRNTSNSIASRTRRASKCTMSTVTFQANLTN